MIIMKKNKIVLWCAFFAVTITGLTACSANQGNDDGTQTTVESTEVMQSETSIPEQPEYKNTVLSIGSGEKPDVSYRYNEEHNSWDEVYGLENVSMIYDTADNKVYLEFVDSREEVLWAVQRFGGGMGMSMGLLDMTEDGSDDLVVEVHDRELTLYFVYDLKNKKDLSPFYCTDASNIFSAYMYPQYAEELVDAVNENFSETPELEGKSVAAEDDGSLKADCMYLRNDADGVEMYQNVIDDKVLCYHWYEPIAQGTMWNCDFDFSFEGGEGRISGIETANGYQKYAELIDVSDNNAIEGHIEYSEGHFYMVFDGENINIKVLALGKYSTFEVYYHGIKLDTDELTIDMENAEKLYFEVADEDGDGTDDSLVINKKMGGEWGRTVLDIL